MAAYSQDLRERVLRARERGESPTTIARRLEVSRVWVYQVWNRYQQSGERASRKIGGYRRPKLQDSEELLRSWIKAEPDLTLVEICARLKTQGIGVSPSTLWYRLDRLGLTVKKNAARRRARTS